MQEKQLMYYEHLSSKVHLKYKTSFPMSAEIIKLEDLYYGKEYCYGIDNYIKKFIEVIKDKVIRYLPNLKKVQIILGVFDNNNLFHHIIILVYNMMTKILKKELININLYKSIFVIIKYEGEQVFMGSLNFDRII
jgi:hypothetical protein